jgi:FG-GAP-like repeat
MNLKKLVISHLLTLVLVFFSLKNGVSQISFAPFKTFPTDGLCTAVALGDLDNDGDLDAATTDYSTFGSLRLSLYEQSSSGLVFHEKMTLPSGWGISRSIQSGDLNGDGRDDLVFPCTSNEIGLLFQTPNGWFVSTSTLKTGNTPDCVAIGDLNGDGINDIAVSNWNDLFLTVFYQKSDHTGFIRQDFPCKEGGWTEIEIADSDSDGRLDVFLMQGQGFPGVFIYRQTLSSILAPALEIPLAGSFDQSMGIATGDLDGDGKSDLAISKSWNSPESGVRLHFQGATNGILSQFALLNAYEIPEAALIDDFNCDGQNELALAHGGWGKVSIFQSGVSGDFNSYSLYGLPYASHYAPQAIAAGDLTGDGLPEIMVANFDQGLVMLVNESQGSAMSPNIMTTFLFETKTEDRDTIRTNSAFLVEKRDTLDFLVTIKRDSFLIEKTRIETVLQVDSVFLLKKTTCSGSTVDTLHELQPPVISIWEEADTIFLASRRDSFLLPQPIPKWSCKLFPNPTLGELSIEFSTTIDTLAQVELELFATDGKKLSEISETLNWLKPNLLSLHFEGLPSGFYFLRLRSEEGICKLPFLKVNK